MKQTLVILGALTVAASLSAADLPGKAIYDKTKCDACHGKTGMGNPAMAKVFKVEPAALDLASAATAAKSDATLRQAIEKGRGKMPAYGTKLKSEDLDALVAYIRSLAPAKKAAQ